MLKQLQVTHVLTVQNKYMIWNCCGGGIAPKTQQVCTDLTWVLGLNDFSSFASGQQPTASSKCFCQTENLLSHSSLAKVCYSFNTLFAALMFPCFWSLDQPTSHL